MTLSKSTDLIPHRLSFNSKCMVYVDDVILINEYKINIGFFTINDNPILTDIALDKIDIFFELLMTNAILMTKENYNTGRFSDFTNNVFMVPEANDQSVGSILFLKLGSLVQDNLEIAYVEISSDLGKNICYTINENSPEPIVLLPDKNKWWGDAAVDDQPWWCRSDTATLDRLTADGIYRGEFSWDDFFADELKLAEELLPTKKRKFKLITGGKDAN